MNFFSLKYHRFAEQVVAAWLSGNVRVAHINEVTLRRARLVLGWVTVREFVPRSHRLGI